MMYATQETHGCVYFITHRRTSKVYVGSTTDWNIRLNDHKMKLQSNSHSNPGLQADFNLGGFDAFTFLPVYETDDPVELEHYERVLHGILVGGGASVYNRIPNWGVPSTAHRQRISAAMMGRTHSDETRKKMAAQKRGKKRKPFTDEHLKNMSLSHPACKAVEVTSTEGTSTVYHSFKEVCRQLGVSRKLVPEWVAKYPKPVTKGKMKGYTFRLVENHQ